MSGIDERPVKEEVQVKDLIKDLRTTMDGQERPRLGLRFGMFDKSMFVMGLSFFSLFIFGFMSSVEELRVLGAFVILPMAAVYLGIGCVRHERNR